MRTANQSLAILHDPRQCPCSTEVIARFPRAGTERLRAIDEVEVRGVGDNERGRRKLRGIVRCRDDNPNAADDEQAADQHNG